MIIFLNKLREGTKKSCLEICSKLLQSFKEVWKYKLRLGEINEMDKKCITFLGNCLLHVVFRTECHCVISCFYLPDLLKIFLGNTFKGNVKIEIDLWSKKVVLTEVISWYSLKIHLQILIFNTVFYLALEVTFLY